MLVAAIPFVVLERLQSDFIVKTFGLQQYLFHSAETAG